MTKIRQSARGEECTVRIPYICNWNPETTVYAHINDGTQGAGKKASDLSGVYACSACHDEIDRRTRRISVDALDGFILRAMQKTQRKLVEKGLLAIGGGVVKR